MKKKVALVSVCALSRSSSPRE